MKLYADLEDLHSLLPVEIVVADEGGDASFEIMKPVLMMTAVTFLPSVPVTFIYNSYINVVRVHFQRSSEGYAEPAETFCQRSLFTCPNHNLFSAV